jgi:addiction module HigA family antidote
MSRRPKQTITHCKERLLLNQKANLLLLLFITRPNLSSIVNGKAGISALMATKLAKAFKTSPQYWMNIQASYDLWQVSQREKETIDEVKQLV